MSSDCNDVERKKMGFQKALLSLLVNWRDLEPFLDNSSNASASTKSTHDEVESNVGFVEKLGLDKTHVADSQNPINDKLKVVDLNEGPYDNLAQLLEIEAKKLKESWEKLGFKEKEMGRNQVVCEEKSREIDCKMREIEFSRSFIEERAKELELRQKELDHGFKELEVKMGCAEKRAKLVELEEQKLKERFKEIEGKRKEVELGRKFAEERAKQQELKQKELDDGFKELELKKMEFTKMTNKSAGMSVSNADTSTSQSKRKRLLHDMSTTATPGTSLPMLPSPQVHHTPLAEKAEKTFWTRCPSCKFLFMYLKAFVNKPLKCKTCLRIFTARELDPESVPSKANVLTIIAEEHAAKTDNTAGINTSHADKNVNQCAEEQIVNGSNETIMQAFSMLKAIKSDATAANAVNGTASNTNLSSSTTDIIVCPDTEFTDFDKYKNEKKIQVDQVWACFEAHDALPILYARIRKVLSPDFKLLITYLQPHPEDQNSINWVKAGLPVVCGKFIHEETTTTTKPLMFSHQIHFDIGDVPYTYYIYPRKGEIWALFKDWNIGWSADPENHRNFKYVMVEILSDFFKETGVVVCYLVKLKGSVSVFKRAAKTGLSTFVIPSRELLRFSHNVFSRKLTGAEREGIPAGAFEVDTASLPVDRSKLWQPEEMETDA